MEQKLSAKERILAKASELFYREGVRAVGIDRIIDESGVAKASFYRNFATKDDLVVAYLERRRQINKERFDRARREHPDDPARQLQALAELLVDRAGDKNYRGCPFMNTAVEFPDKEHPGNRKANEIHRELWNGVEELARKAGADEPQALAMQLRMLSSGMIMVSSMDHDASDQDRYMNAVRLIVRHHLPQKV